jgi:hypothetical protein
MRVLVHAWQSWTDRQRVRCSVSISTAFATRADRVSGFFASLAQRTYALFWVYESPAKNRHAVQRGGDHDQRVA